jgi:BlaI family transcriptional regulator, penicillinase repressor
MRNSPRRPGKPLSELEYQIMEILWKRGPANSEQVRDALASKRPLKDSTIRTVLRRLEEKGYATHRIEGRTYVYYGVEPPRNVAIRAVRNIIDRFCGGSVEQLLVGMVENEMLNRSELQQLSRMIAQRRKPPKGE